MNQKYPRGWFTSTQYSNAQLLTTKLQANLLGSHVSQLKDRNTSRVTMRAFNPNYDMSKTTFRNSFYIPKKV